MTAMLAEDRKTETSLARRFEDVAAAHPARLAVQSPTSSCSYGELNRLANRLAHALTARGAVPGSRIALLMRHDQAQIVAMIAVLKIAGIVVALNTGDIVERLREVVGDAEPTLIVADAAHRELAARVATCAIIDYGDATPAHDDNPHPSTSPDGMAFLVYTSGTTGRPRGVIRTSNGVLHSALANIRSWELTPDDRVALLLPLTGGVALTIAWAALAGGATLQPFDVAQMSATKLASELTERGTTVFCSTASFFRSFAKALPDNARFPTIRVMRLGTEAAVSSDFEAFKRLCSPASMFIHSCGSSEAGAIAQLKLGHRAVVAEGRLPAGDIPDDIEVRLVDEADRDVPRGEAGELVIRSAFMAIGYWKDEALTAEKFSEDRGVPVFRSGDIGRINGAGQLELIGRRDDFVKVRGHRIALAEVEGAVLALPEVSSAAVAATKDETPRLVAFVVAEKGRSLQPAELRGRLREKIPAFMIPSHFVMMDALPLGKTGKVDRAALAAMPLGRDRAAAEAPVTETEAALAGIWADALKLPSVGRSDNFFDLGGDSLVAAVIVAQVYAGFGIEIGLQAFADFPTLDGFAAYIDAAPRAAEEQAAPERADRSRPLPLSLLQERVWKYSQTPEQSKANTQFMVFRVHGALDRELLHASIVKLVERHELLRTSFAVVDGTPVQIVHPEVEVKLDYVDLSGRRDAEEEAQRLCARAQARPLDFAKAPLLRYLLIRTAENEHLLARQIHQLVKDKWSNAVFMKELGLLYEAGSRGSGPPQLESIQSQYADYAVWQRKVMGPGMPFLQQSLTWWARNLVDARPIELGHLRHDGREKVSLEDVRITWPVSPNTVERLKAVSRAQHATYYAVQRAALAAFLAEETGSTNIVIGSYVSVRRRPWLQNTFGPFLNLVALHYRVEPALSFRDWIAIARDVLTASEENSDLPYDLLSDELAAQGVQTPEMRLIFNSMEEQTHRIGDLTMTAIRSHPRTMPWGFTLVMDTTACWVVFDGGLYRPAAVEAFLQRFTRLLDALAERPEAPMRDLFATTPVRSSFSGLRPETASALAAKPSLPRRIAGRIRRLIGRA